MKLVTGVRCVERNPETIFRTLESAKNAGLADDLYIFVDGEFQRRDELAQYGVVVQRTKRAGAWPNFFLSLAELYQREPRADLYALLEDDVVFCLDLRRYLENWHDRLNVASLFTSARVEAEIQSRGAGFHRQNPGWHISSGGQAWLFGNSCLLKFLQSSFVVNYRRDPPKNLNPKDYRFDGLYHTDSVVGQFCHEIGCGIQYHYPSLAQHIGDESFMYPGLRAKQDIRYAGSFPGEDVSVMDFISEQAGNNESSPQMCVVLVPVQGAIERDCETGLQELERRGYPVWRVHGYAAIDQGRNQMASDALRQGFAETMWIDADIAFDPDDVDRLRRHQLPISCGIYPQKGKRSLAIHVMPGTEKILFGQGGGLTEILYAATGFLHVRREVYETVQRKLSLPACNESFGAGMIPFFLPMIIDHPQRGKWYLAEDYAFSERVRQSGYGIFADTTMRLRHIGKFGYTWEEAGADPQRFASYTFHLH